jgi:hypothetical protein
MGIDYGMGRTNIDHRTGIRYGVIPIADVSQAWIDDSEADYGEPTCPKCGNPVEDVENSDREDIDDLPHYRRSGCDDYVCESCGHTLDSADVYGDEPLGYYIDDREYKAFSDDHGDIMIVKSPFYALCDYCSPCAPGAGHLHDKGDVKTYCFGADWFDDDSPCPYAFYCVETGKLLYTPTEK